MRATRLLFSAIWLAGSSVCLSLTLYVLGAHEVAVIELSVGAGLVAVLFVFAIAAAGDDALAAHSLVPRWLAGTVLAAALVLLGWLGLTVVPGPAPSAEPSFAQVLWQQRSLDVLLQVVIVFAGVMGVLGLLGGSALAARSLATQSPAHELATAGDGHVGSAPVAPAPEIVAGSAEEIAAGSRAELSPAPTEPRSEAPADGMEEAQPVGAAGVSR